jgi:hypothetical protein
VGCGGEGGGVADLGEDAGSGPDSDAGHRGKDRGKRVRLQQVFDLGLQVLAMVERVLQGSGEAGQYYGGGLSVGHYDGLLFQRGEDLAGQAFGHARRVAPQQLGDRLESRRANARGTAQLDQQAEHRGVGDARADDPFEVRVDGGEQAADAVAGPRRFGREVVVMSEEHV